MEVATTSVTEPTVRLVNLVVDGDELAFSRIVAARHADMARAFATGVDAFDLTHQ